ncbi:MAG: hypothetical protein PVJ57_14800 [Phycisphaerae bacterium]|jgi:hypothetical protein
MKATAIIVMIAGLGLLAQAQPTYTPREVPDKPDELPPEAVTETMHDIDLAPGGQSEVQVPTHPGGTIVHVHFATPAELKRSDESLTPQERVKPTRTPRRPHTRATIEKLLRKRINEQKVSRSPLCKFDLYVNDKAVRAHAVFDGDENTFEFMLRPGTPTAHGVLTNTTKEQLKGRLLIQCVDQQRKQRAETFRQRTDLREALAKIEDPSLAWVFKRLFERHKAGYPGGQSPVERSFSENLAQSGIAPEVLDRLMTRAVDNLNQEESSVVSRLGVKALRTADIHQQVSVVTARAALVSKLDIPPQAEETPPEEAPAKYVVHIVGIKSLRCADDENWEWGCDGDEPYVAWICFGPGYTRCGRTEKAPEITRNKEYLYCQDQYVVSDSISSANAIAPPEPLFFIYQVLEADSGSPSKEEVIATLQLVASAGVAVAEGDWNTAATQAVAGIVGTFDLFIRACAGGDDCYPIKWAVLNHANLLTITSGTAAAPLDVDFFDSDGDYDGWSVRVVDVGRRPDWKVAYMVTRELEQ